MEKFNKEECSCLFICKYPPPKKLAPVFNIEEFKNTNFSSPPVKYRIH
jgi:hypothetical protein